MRPRPATRRKMALLGFVCPKQIERWTGHDKWWVTRQKSRGKLDVIWEGRCLFIGVRGYRALIGPVAAALLPERDDLLHVNADGWVDEKSVVEEYEAIDGRVQESEDEENRAGQVERELTEERAARLRDPDRARCDLCGRSPDTFAPIEGRLLCERCAEWEDDQREAARRASVTAAVRGRPVPAVERGDVLMSVTTAPALPPIPGAPRRAVAGERVRLKLPLALVLAVGRACGDESALRHARGKVHDPHLLSVHLTAEQSAIVRAAAEADERSLSGWAVRVIRARLDLPKTAGARVEWVREALLGAATVKAEDGSTTHD